MYARAQIVVPIFVPLGLEYTMDVLGLPWFDLVEDIGDQVKLKDGTNLQYLAKYFPKFVHFQEAKYYV